MARQANHQKPIPVGRRRPGESEAHASKTKTSRNKVYKVSKTVSPPKSSRERTKKCVLVKPLTKNDVRKLQHVNKHVRSSQISKHRHVVEPPSESEDLATAFHESLEEARACILKQGRTAFDKAHTALVQKLNDNKAKDRLFIDEILHSAEALCAPLAAATIQTTVQHKNRRVSQVVEIGKRVHQFKEFIESEGIKLDAYWKTFESLQREFVKLCAQIFSGKLINEVEEDEGYRIDMKALDTEHETQMNVLWEEIDEIGHEAIKKLKASEKEIDIKADKVRQRIVGAMMW